MAALADPIDVESRLGRAFTDVEAGRVAYVLDDVSAVVRQYTGRDFTAGSHTVRLRAKNGVIRLRELPVSSITSVTDKDGNDLSYQWDGLDRVTVWPASGVDWFEREWTAGASTVVVVTYVGGAGVPDAVKAVVCNMTARALGQTPDQGGLQQESISAYSYSVGAAGAAGPAGLMNDERAVLDRYRRVGSTAVLG